jgi:hypothetical protein
MLVQKVCIIRWLEMSLSLKQFLGLQKTEGVKMPVQMKGVWSRKTVEFADAIAMNKARTCISQHPYTIATMEDWSKDYAEAYGAEELAILKASCRGSKFNMVQSFNKAWVVDGTFIPNDPKPEEVLKEGYEWQVWGTERRQIPIGTVAKAQPATVTGLDPDTKKELAAIVFDAVTHALETWTVKQQ